MEAFEREFGCEIVYLPRFEDDRGFLNVLTPAGIGETPYMYFSVTHVGKSRDADQWHLHHKHTDRFVVLRGEAMFFLSNGIKTVFYVLGHPDRMLIVPPGVLHCFQNIGDVPVEIVNLPDAVYDPEDEIRIPVKGAE